MARRRAGGLSAMGGARCLALLLSLAASASGLRRGRQRGGAGALDATGALRSREPYRQRLENYHELIYHGTIDFGGQPVQAVFDTGSFDVVVVSQRCEDCKHVEYDSSESHTHRLDPHGYTEEHNYVSGPTTTALAFERVSVGPLTNENQSIFEITSHNVSILDKGVFSAVVGIGPEGNNHSMPSLLRGLGIDEYSLCLESKVGGPGWLTWNGDLTPEKKAQAKELQVVGKYHWALRMQDLLPADSLTEKQREAAQTLLCGRGCAAILDSGTSLISAPSHALQGLKYLLPELNENCSNFGDLPDLEFTLGDQKLRLPPQAYAIRLAGTPEEKASLASLLAFKPSFSQALTATCMYAFINLDHHTDFGPLWILGMPFFRTFHVTFGLSANQTDRRIWLSQASDDCEPLPLDSSTNTTIDPNAKFEGFGVYPKVVVAQHTTKRVRTGGPLTIEARDVVPPRVPAGVL